MKKLATISHIKINYRLDAKHASAELVHEEGGYQLCVCSDGDQLVVTRRDGDIARSWTSVDRALIFIKRQFGLIREVKLILNT